MQLLKLQADDDEDIRQYLMQTTNFISPQAQQEIMELFSHTRVRQISREINQNEQFEVMVDGTQDVSGKEQECVYMYSACGL